MFKSGIIYFWFGILPLIRYEYVLISPCLAMILKVYLELASFKAVNASLVTNEYCLLPTRPWNTVPRGICNCAGSSESPSPVTTTVK